MPSVGYCFEVAARESAEQHGPGGEVTGKAEVALDKVVSDY